MRTRGSSPSRTGSVARNRDRDARRGGSSSRGSNTRRNSQVRVQGRPTGVPRGLSIALMVVMAVLAAAVTFLIMNPRLQSARQEAKKANSEIAELTSEIHLLEEKVRAAESASAAGVDSPWLASGKFTTGDATLDKEVKEFCDSHCTTDMKVDDAALLVYEGVAWSEYVERDDAQNPSGPNWRIEYARKYYEHDCTGNCYEFACFNMYCLRYLGYSDAMAEAVIIEMQSGDWGDHGIVFVTNTDGRKCLIDTSMGVNGWMLDTDVYNYEIKDVAGTGTTSSDDTTSADATDTTTSTDTTTTTTDTSTTTTDAESTTESTTSTASASGATSTGKESESTGYVGVSDSSKGTAST